MSCNVCYNRQWLEILIQESFREDEDLSLTGVKVLMDSARGIIWNMCTYFKFNNVVEGKTSRIFVQYVASLERWLMWHSGIGHGGLVIQIVGPQLPLVVGVCFNLATKSFSARAGITHQAIHSYFESMGVYQYTVSRIHEMEMEIFKRIGYRLPLYSCKDMAEMLAAELEVPAPVLNLVNSLVEGSEARRNFIEHALLAVMCEMRYISTHDGRIKTLHLAASCVVAASQRELGLSAAMLMAGRLEQLLRVSKLYIRTLANVILAEAAGQPPQYCFNLGLNTPHEDVL